MEPPSHHELLCVSPDATADEIRASYRRLIRMYHPDVAGAAGAAMTQRLNEAQEALLNPSAYRPRSTPRSSANQPRSATRPPSANFQREWAPPHKTRPAPAARTSAEWMIVAAISVFIIAVSTIVVLAFTYSGPIGLSVRVLPAIIMALVWMTGGLRKPPMITFLLLGLGILSWPLALANVSVLGPLATEIPLAVWIMLTLSFFAMISLRIAAPRASWSRRTKTA